MSHKIDELIKWAEKAEDVRVSDYRSVLVVAAAIDRLADMMWYTKFQCQVPERLDTDASEGKKI
jgi:hypothetical protein